MKINSILLFLTIIGLSVFSISARAEGESSHLLIVHAAEIGIGKFHRYDNTQHKYVDGNIWKNYILPDGATTKTPLVRDNDDKSVTVFFSTLEELLQSIQKISDERKTKVAVLNINAHGLPGAMWFPYDEATKKSGACSSWNAAANGDDKGNYDQYYSPVSKAEILQIRMMAKLPSMQFSAPCTTGASQWAKVLKRNPKVKEAFASDAQLHLFSCVVGLGWSGKRFTSKLVETLFSGEGAKVEASMNFGLGDWSMPEGMGFWDYLTDEQLDRDNAKYPVDREDRELMQKGQIRVAMIANRDTNVGIVENLDFMLGTKDDLDARAFGIFEESEATATVAEVEHVKANGLKIRIPGTTQVLDVTVR